MPDRNPPPAGGSRFAVIDVGSNSLRLVVFERLGGALLPLLNEKIMCGLGRGIAATGRLNADGVALAHANLRRFVALARAIGIDHLAVIATAAVREASNGPAFAAVIERECGVTVQIIDGAEEARLSAAGVLAGIPDADGVVGDLGGGSVELIRVSPPSPRAVAGESGIGITLPLGPLRLAEFADNPKALSETIERTVGDAPVLRAATGKTLYLVGGAWRAIARLHMEHVRYPLHIIHQYTVARRDIDAFTDIIARQSRRSLDRITAVSRKRAEVVPLAALILRQLVAVARPEQVMFSAFGLREGYVFELLPAAERGGDPLIAACTAIAATQSRFRGDGDALQRWLAPVFPNLGDGACRLHRAACWLSDIAWSEHPDYRAEQAFTRSLRMPFGGLAHRERVFIARALHGRYGGGTDDKIIEPTQLLLDDAATAQARSLGLALRLAYTLCGGAIDLLAEVRLARDGGGLVLEVPASGDLFVGETVQRRLDALGRSLGLATATRRRDARRPVPA